MTYGVQTFDASGTLLWDSTTAIGGVFGDYQQFASGASGTTLNYPQWAGLSAYLLDCGNAAPYMTLSTGAGYPIVTVTSPAGPMAFALVVY